MASIVSVIGAWAGSAGGAAAAGSAAGTAASAGTAAAAGSAAASGITAMGAVQGLAAIASMGMTIGGSMQASEQADYQARIAELNGRANAVAINEELLQSMASNNVAAAASGLQTSGSVSAASAASQAKATQQLTINNLNTANAVADAQQSSSNATVSGISSALNTGTGVLAGAYNTYKTVKTTG